VQIPETAKPSMEIAEFIPGSHRNGPDPFEKYGCARRHPEGTKDLDVNRFQHLIRSDNQAATPGRLKVG
jgi:hypothetical protein